MKINNNKNKYLFTVRNKKFVNMIFILNSESDDKEF